MEDITLAEAVDLLATKGKALKPRAGATGKTTARGRGAAAPPSQAVRFHRGVRPVGGLEDREPVEDPRVVFDLGAEGRALLVAEGVGGPGEDRRGFHEPHPRVAVVVAPEFALAVVETPGPSCHEVRRTGAKLDSDIGRAEAVEHREQQGPMAVGDIVAVPRGGEEVVEDEALGGRGVLSERAPRVVVGPERGAFADGAGDRLPRVPRQVDLLHVSPREPLLVLSKAKAEGVLARAIHGEAEGGLEEAALDHLGGGDVEPREPRGLVVHLRVEAGDDHPVLGVVEVEGAARDALERGPLEEREVEGLHREPTPAGAEEDPVMSRGKFGLEREEAGVRSHDPGGEPGSQGNAGLGNRMRGRLHGRGRECATGNRESNGKIFKVQD